MNHDGDDLDEGEPGVLDDPRDFYDGVQALPLRLEAIMAGQREWNRMVRNTDQLSYYRFRRWLRAVT